MKTKKKKKKMVDILTAFTPSEAEYQAKSRAGALSVVNTEQHGKRVKISKHLLQQIGNPASVQFSFNKNKIAVAANLRGCTVFYDVKKGGCIYSSALVQEITQKFELDFSNITCISTGQAKYQTLDDGETVAIIKMKKKKN